MRALSDLVDAFLIEEFDLSPVRASSLGLTEYDDRLDDLSAETFRRRDGDAVDWMARFGAFPDDELTFDERIDRDLALAMLRGRTILAGWENWRRDPLNYTDPVFDGIHELFLHRLRPEAELVDAAVARLAQVPRAVDQGIANLDPALAHLLIVERAEKSARGGARYFRDLLPAEVSPGATRDRLVAAGEHAAAALERWTAHLNDLKARATGTWVLGEERYTRLLREREHLGFDARELRERGRAEYDRLDAEMRALARQARGTDDWNDLLEAESKRHAPTEEGMRAEYEEWTGRAREFLRTTGLVTLPPGERCVVEPNPVFRRPVIGVASYHSPPSFSDLWLGHFFVPIAPDGAAPAEIQQRLESNSSGEIPTVAVHEAYPGHHWHLIMRKRNPSRLRKVFGTPYFNEGWALYAERVMRERGFFTDPIQELFHLKSTIFRAARIVVDTSLHLGEMTSEEAVRFMQEKAGLPEPTARAEVGRYCAWPTQASAYLTGCLEILRIRERYLAARGFARTSPADVPVEVLRDFHDRLTGSGSLPLGLAEQVVLEH